MSAPPPTMPDPLEHRVDCPAPALHTFRGRLGDLLVRCRNCGRVRPTPGGADHPEPYRPRPSVDERLRDAQPLDDDDHRQAQRRGDGWPRHKARNRGNRRRKPRERTAP